MNSCPRSIVIDARVNGMPGAHGLARSVVRLAEHLGSSTEELTVRILVNKSREQLFSLNRLAEQAELVDTHITLGAVHRAGELARLLRHLDAAVLYSPYPLHRPVLCPCPVVVTVHDCTIERSARFAGGLLRQVAMGAAARAVLNRASAVTTPTLASLADVRKYYPRASNLTVIPNGVDTEPFANVGAREMAAARARYDLPERFILAVGAHRPHKNYEVLLRAMPDIPPDYSLVIVGYLDPRFPQPVPGLIAGLGLEQRVRLLPSVADELLPAVFSAASVLALPSLAEGYGLPALEAMAAGVPVVASAISVFEEVCSSAALLVPPHDACAWASALTTVIGGGFVGADLITAGRKLAAATTWEQGGDAMAKLLTKVARGEL
jgi:glycosyltransferase involved in cell wall biosynthesis